MTSTCETPLTDLGPSAADVFKVVFGLEAVSGTLLTATIVGIFIKHKSLWTFSNASLLSLIISDLLVSAVLTPLAVVRLSFPQGDSRLCALRTSAFVVSSLLATSALSVSVIAYERYQCIFRSDHYQQFMSVRRKLVLISFPWLVPLVIIPVRLSDDRIFIWILIALYVICYSLIVSSYLLLIGVLNQRNAQLNQSGISESENGSFLLIMRQNRKAAKMIFAIVCAFIICTLGTFTYRILMTISIFKEGGLEFFDVHGPLVHAVGLALFKLNSTVNPIIYFRGHPGIKQAMRRLRRRIKIRKREVNPAFLAERSWRHRVPFNSPAHA